MVTFERKGVDFQRVIILVINVGCSHFSNNCHVIYKLSCNISTILVAPHAIYNFASHL